VISSANYTFVFADGHLASGGTDDDLAGRAGPSLRL
jgi:hypothetical protein